VADRAEGLLKGDRNLGFADLAVFTGVERVVGEPLQVVRPSGRECDDLGHDGGIEPDGRGGEGSAIARVEASASSAPSVMGSTKRTSGSWAPLTVPNGPGATRSRGRAWNVSNSGH